MQSFGKSLPSFPECLKRWPRVTAAVMGCGYLTEQEAAIIVRDYIRKREGFHDLSCCFWVPLNPVDFGNRIRAIRQFPTWYATNLWIVRRYLTF